jgi:biotin carboxyl carrier protein
MKLTIEIGGQTHEAEFTREGATAQLAFGEQIHQAAISQPEAGFYTVLLNDRVFRCAFDVLPNGQVEIVVNGVRYPVTVRDKKQRQTNAGGAAAGGKAVLAAPMPGKVVRVMCAVGDEVETNQGLLVVEAMKMQNEVQSPKAGKVVELKVVEGQTVNAGETMIVVA